MWIIIIWSLINYIHKGIASPARGSNGPRIIILIRSRRYQSRARCRPLPILQSRFYEASGLRTTDASVADPFGGREGGRERERLSLSLALFFFSSLPCSSRSTLQENGVALSRACATLRGAHSVVVCSRNLVTREPPPPSPGRRCNCRANVTEMQGRARRCRLTLGARIAWPLSVNYNLQGPSLYAIRVLLE